jgi:hypothetical protein
MEVKTDAGARAPADPVGWVTTVLDGAPTEGRAVLEEPHWARPGGGTPPPGVEAGRDRRPERPNLDVLAAFVIGAVLGILWRSLLTMMEARHGSA